MIIELFGLSKTGKSISASNLRKINMQVVDFEKISKLRKIFLFINYIIKNPVSSIYLFYKLNSNHILINFKVLKMRNSYLSSVFAKYEMIKNNKDRIFTEEFSLQSIFMILQRKSSKNEIEKIIKKLPKSDLVLLFERDKEERHRIYRLPHPTFNNPTMYPGGWIGESYAKKWMENMEYNFEIIKKIILEDSKEDRLIFKDIDLKLPKAYAFTL